MNPMNWIFEPKFHLLIRGSTIFPPLKVFFDSLTFRLRHNFPSPLKTVAALEAMAPHRHWKRQLVLPNSESSTASPHTSCKWEDLGLLALKGIPMPQ